MYKLLPLPIKGLILQRLPLDILIPNFQFIVSWLLVKCPVLGKELLQSIKIKTLCKYQSRGYHLRAYIGFYIYLVVNKLKPGSYLLGIAEFQDELESAQTRDSWWYQFVKGYKKIETYHIVKDQIVKLDWCVPNFPMKVKFDWSVPDSRKNGVGYSEEEFFNRLSNIKTTDTFSPSLEITNNQILIKSKYFTTPIDLN